MSKHNDTIITPNEVAHYSPVSLPFNVCTFAQLYNIEYRQALELLGLGLYRALVEAKADYSEVAYEWESETEYAEDDVVVYKGLYWVSKMDMNTTEPGTAPYWKPAPKFDQGTECGERFEVLWCRHLAPYLAALVLAQRLPFIQLQVKDVGVVKYSGQDYSSATQEEYDRLLAAVWRDVELCKDNMLRWMIAESSETDCFGVFNASKKCFEMRHEQTSMGLGASKGSPGRYDFG
jgi:hypothetical protein